MSIYASAPEKISGPSSDRVAFMRRVGAYSTGGLALAAIVGGVSMFTIAPMLLSVGWFGGLIAVLGTWLIAHFVARKMVYGSAKMAGFILACVCEGIAFGFLLLTVVAKFGVDGGLGLVVQALGLVGMTSLGMLIYVWFSKGQLKLLGAFLSMAFVPLLVLMVVSVFFPFGGTLGLIVSGAFVLISAGGLLWKLNHVTQEYDESMHIEGAYEITMALLVLLWNVIVLLDRLRR